MKLCETLGMCTPDTNLINISSGLVQTFEFLLLLLFIGIIGYNIYNKKYLYLKKIGITAVAVILFEIIANPYTTTTGFSNWSYYYHDLSIFLTLSWTLVLLGSFAFVNKVYKKASEPENFWFYLLTITIFAILLEIILVKIGFRFYSESTLTSSYGLFIPSTSVPIGIIFLIPAMFTLGITFIKYWEYVMESKK
jgi:hypothetical protein